MLINDVNAKIEDGEEPSEENLNFIVLPMLHLIGKKQKK